MAIASRQRRDRGAALVAVLGAIVLLATVAFTLAEASGTAVDRASLASDSLQAYFLARGGIEAVLSEDGSASSAMTDIPSTRRYSLEAGDVEVSIEPQDGRLNVNRASEQSLSRLATSAGAAPGDARAIARGILMYRRARPRAISDVGADRSSFGPRTASIQVVEELLSVQSMTSDLFHGTYRQRNRTEDGDSSLQRVEGMERHLRTRGPATVNLNAASANVLVAAGLDRPLAQRVVSARQQAPLQPGDALAKAAVAAARLAPLGWNSDVSVWSVTSTGTVRGARAERRVAATVARGPDGLLRVDRWFEQVH